MRLSLLLAPRRNASFRLLRLSSSLRIASSKPAVWEKISPSLLGSAIPKSWHISLTKDPHSLALAPAKASAAGKFSHWANRCPNSCSCSFGRVFGAGTLRLSKRVTVEFDVPKSTANQPGKSLGAAYNRRQEAAMFFRQVGIAFIVGIEILHAHLQSAVDVCG